MTTRGRQAIDVALRQSTEGPRIDRWLGEDEPGGWCLKAVRTCYGVASKYRSAAAAWEAAPMKHPNSTPPAGVPVYWTGGRGGFGHVAISAGDGRVWSTDSRRVGYFDLVPIGAPAKDWGLTYAGWSPYVNDVRVYLDPWAKAPEFERVDKALTRIAKTGATAAARNLARRVRRVIRQEVRR